MIPILEPKYILFESVEQMLAPETLSALLSKPVTCVLHEPISGHPGVAGSQLICVDTDVGQLVLKRMSISTDVLMASTTDEQCRAVRLWQYGLLDRLRPHLEHKILACSQDGAGWAILMEDLSTHTFNWDEALPPELVPVFLDALARLHATFWNDPGLPDARLGLCDTLQLIDWFHPAQVLLDPKWGVIPGWIRAGWQAMQEILPAEVYAHMRNLIENPQPLLETLSHYPYTLLHGDYRMENLAHNGHPIVLDWQLASRSLMTLDLAWFTKWSYIQDVMSHEQAIHFYRQRLEAYLSQPFEELEWQAMVDLGFGMDALRGMCLFANGLKNDTNPDQRDFNERMLKQQSQMILDALRWL